MARISIAFVTADDPRDKRSWSGTNHFMWKAIEKHIGEVDILGPYKPQPLWFFCSAFNFVTLRLLGKRFDYRHSKVFSRAYGKYFSRRIAAKKYDLVVISASIAAASGMETNVPCVYINDRVLAGALNYHKILTQLFAFSRRQSLAMDRLAIEKSSFSVFSSHWAGNAAKDIHGFSPEKVKVIPFGANLEVLPAAPAQTEFPPEVVRLLFVGVQWIDKGGPVAYSAFLELLKSGVNAELTVVGCTPPEDVKHEKLKVTGFLDKNSPNDFSTLTALFRNAHFFILPTKFEAYGLVFCEAAAYGIPVLAPATGGIPTIVENGVTGFLLPENADGKAYAEKMKLLLDQPEQWHHMRNAAHRRFTEQLNWEAWANAMNASLKEKGIIS